MACLKSRSNWQSQLSYLEFLDKVRYVQLKRLDRRDVPSQKDG